MQPEHGKQCLAGGLAQNSQIIAFDSHSQFPNKNQKNRLFYFVRQAVIACGSMVSQTPAWRSRANPFRSSGRTTKSEGSAVILTMAALADAAARKTSWALHHGGKTTATISAPGRTCSDSAAIAIQLAISKAAAFSQAGHRDAEMVLSRSIAREDTWSGLMSGK
jgi:hypothetical protein